jgi:hypothetical protein
MADSPILPGVQAWKDGSGKPLPPEFFRFLRDLVRYIQQIDGNTEELAAILARLDALEASGDFIIAGPQSVKVAGTPAGGFVQVNLDGDSASPLPVSFYATNEAQQKGWQLLQPHWVPNPYADYLVDENGDYMIDENGNFLTSDDGFPINPDYLPDHNDINGLQGGASDEYYHLTSAQHALAASLSAGTYTPTLTNVTNISASTAQVCQYLRVGNTVTVSGRLDVTATAAGGTASQVDISLPIASNFSSAGQLGGTAVVFYSPSVPAGILPDTANDRARVLFAAQNTLSMAVTFSFTYLVV